MITEDVFLGRRKMVTTCRLKRLDLLLGHVDQEGEVGGISPKTDCRAIYKGTHSGAYELQTLSKFQEHEPLGFLFIML
jgi:hypothetical protein